jgi:hypothetical protein
LDSNTLVPAGASGQEIFHLVRSKADQNDREFSAHQRLRTRDSLIDCQQHLITAVFGSLPEIHW